MASGTLSTQLRRITGRDVTGIALSGEALRPYSVPSRRYRCRFVVVIPPSPSIPLSSSIARARSQTPFPLLLSFTRGLGPHRLGGGEKRSTA